MEVPIVFDLGSTYAKWGFATDVLPHDDVSIVGHHRNHQKGHPCYFGTTALTTKGLIIREHPIQRGLISDLYFMEEMWRLLYDKELMCDPRQHPVVMLEYPLTPKNSREKTTQIMFEQFNIPALFFSNPCVAALRAVGRTSGVSLCMGGQTTYCMAVKDGKGIVSTLNTLDIGARDIGTSLAKLVNQKYRDLYGDIFSTTAEQEIAMDLRNKHGYIALDYDNEIQKPEDQLAITYEFPDGQILPFHHELFVCNENLFTPELYGLEKDGIHQMIFNSITKSGLDIKHELFNNIVLSGGNSLIPGLDARLIKELKILAPEYSDIIRIELGHQPLPRQYLSWKGAAMMSTTLDPADWVARAEYDEVGSFIVHSKCPICEL